MIYHITTNTIIEGSFVLSSADNAFKELDSLDWTETTTVIAYDQACFVVLKYLEQAQFDLIKGLILINPEDEVSEGHPFAALKDHGRVNYELIVSKVMIRGVVNQLSHSSIRQVAIRLHAGLIAGDIDAWIEKQSRWLDSHAHLVSDGMYESIDTVPSNLRVNVICGSLKEVERGLLLDERFHLSIGVHPTSVNEVDNDAFEAMMSYLRHPKVIAVGEIGLDYYWDDSFKILQKERLIQQIALANQFNLPVVVHVRDSIEDVYEILSNYPVNAKGVIHCFSHGSQWAQCFVEMGYFIGIGGIVTFKNGENMREVVRSIPLDRLLLETDSPYLAPVPMRGKGNRPEYVAYTGEYVADLLGISISEMMKINAVNYKKLFRKS